MNIENTQAQMRKGILEYCILLIIARNDAYVQDIINKLRASKMLVVEGTVYPLLTRLKNTGLLAYRWEEHRALPGNITTSPNKDVNSCKPWKLRGKN